MTQLAEAEAREFVLDDPLPGDMTRNHRMRRLHHWLEARGIYVRPIFADEHGEEWGYLVVAVDNPYDWIKGK